MKFFIDDIHGEEHVIYGEDAHHITKSLRMKIGEEIILCDKNMIDYTCRIDRMDKNSVFLSVISQATCKNEPDVKITLFQGIAKGEKMDFIIQKSVELGVHKIVPVVMSRCISKPDKKSAGIKQERWKKISISAAKQSKRGIIPEVSNIVNLEGALRLSDDADIKIIFYEGGGKKLSSIINPKQKNISIFIGPEGGFDIEETKLIESKNVIFSTLGPRILRTETAPLAAICSIMQLTGNM